MRGEVPASMSVGYDGSVASSSNTVMLPASVTRDLYAFNNPGSITGARGGSTINFQLSPQRQNMRSQIVDAGAEMRQAQILQQAQQEAAARAGTSLSRADQVRQAAETMVGEGSPVAERIGARTATAAADRAAATATGRDSALRTLERRLEESLARHEQGQATPEDWDVMRRRAQNLWAKITGRRQGPPTQAEQAQFQRLSAIFPTIGSRFSTARQRFNVASHRGPGFS
jgi:hypothetical protein